MLHLPLISFCTVFASVAAVSALSTYDWLLDYQGATADFSMNSNKEITVKYEIGTKRTDIDFTVMTSGCVGDLDGTSPVIAKAYNSTPQSDNNTDIFTAAIDLDMSLLSASQIWDWDEGIRMCAKLDLKSGDKVIKTDKRDINIALFDTKVEFEIKDVNLVMPLPDSDLVTIDINANLTLVLPGLNSPAAAGTKDPAAIIIDEIDEDTMEKILQVIETILGTYLPPDATIIVTPVDGSSDTFNVEIEYKVLCDGGGVASDCVDEAKDEINQDVDDINTAITNTTFLTELKDEAEDQNITDVFDGVGEIPAIPDLQFEVNVVGLSTAVATVQNYVKACTCDDEVNFRCNKNQLGKNDYMNICIESNSNDVKVDYLSYLVMTQGEKEFIIVENRTVTDGELTSKTKVPARNGVHIKSVIPSQFFNYDGPSIAKVTGIVFMKLTGSRRRLGVVIGPELQATGSRALATRGKAGFNIDILLDKRQLGDVIVNDTNESNPNVAKNALTTGVTAAIAVSATVVLAAVVIGVLFVFRKRRRLDKNKKFLTSEPVIATF